MAAWHRWFQRRVNRASWRAARVATSRKRLRALLPLRWRMASRRAAATQRAKAA
jgi:hypothetical protein